MSGLWLTGAFAKLHKFIPDTGCLVITNSEKAMLHAGDVDVEVIPAWEWLLQGKIISFITEYQAIFQTSAAAGSRIAEKECEKLSFVQNNPAIWHMRFR